MQNNKDMMDKFSAEADMALEEYMKLIYERMDADFATVKQDLLKQFQMIFETVAALQKQQKVSPLSFLNLVLSRINIQNGQPSYAVFAYDENLYQDGLQWQGSLDVSCIFSMFYQLEEKLQAMAKTYMGQIIKVEVQREALKRVLPFHQCLIQLCRALIKDLVSLPAYESIHKQDEFVFFISEIYEAANVLYIDRKQRLKDAAVKKQLDENLPVSCFCEDFRQAKLTSYHNKGLFLNYTDLRRCTMRGSSITGAHLLYTKFDYSDMENVDLSGSAIVGVSFDHVNLQGAKFIKGLFDKPVPADYAKGMFYFLPTSFKNADLRGADFTGAKLTGVDFTGAKLTGANFTGAELKGCVGISL